MKKTKILLLLASGWMLPQVANAQSSSANNNWGCPAGFLGWGATSGINPLHVAVNGMTRMHFNGQRLWNQSPACAPTQDFDPAYFTWLQANYTGYNFGGATSTNNPFFYVGMGENNNNNLFNPRTRLHIQGSMINSGGTNVGPGTGFRPWMQTGLYINEFSNHMYLGIYKRDDTGASDGIVNWGDDPIHPGGGGIPNRLRINFTPTGAFLPPAAGPHAPLWTKDREVVSFWPTRQIQPADLRVALNTDNMGLGDFINFATTGPQSHLHMNNAFGNSDYLQITTGGDGTSVNPTGFTASDGVKLGVQGASANVGLSGTALLYQQEERALLFSTFNTVSSVNLDATTPATRERMRLVSVGTPTYTVTGSPIVGTYNPGGLVSSNTRLGISLNPAVNPVVRPLSLLHLGYSTTTNEAGWRPWMEQGIFNVRNPSGNVNDHVYIGFKTEASAERNDAVIGWGNDVGTVPDNLRFIFSAVNTGAVTGPNSASGMEVARFTPDCPTCPVNKASFGIGDFVNTTPYVGATLDVDGDARIRTVQQNVAANLNQVLVRDPADFGRIYWRDASTFTGGAALGNICNTTPPTNPLMNNWEIPMNGKNFRFADPTGTLNDGENFVGIGTTCTPTAKLEVFRNVTVNTLSEVTATYVKNSDIATTTNAGLSYGVSAESDGANKGNYGVKGSAKSGEGNIGIKGEALDPSTGGSNSQFNTGVEANAVGGFANFGLNASAESGAFTSTNYAGFFNASNPGYNNSYNFGVIGYATAAAGSTIVNNVGVAGISQVDPTATAAYDIGVYGEGTNYGGYFVGSFTSSGVTIFSDQKIKTNVKTVENGIQLVKQLNPVTYDFKTNEYPELRLSNKHQYGFIAQEVEAVMPDLVAQANKPEFKDAEGKIISKGVELKGLNYEAIIPVLTKAIQEQQTIIEKQEVDNKALTDRLNKLEECINRLQLCDNNAIPANNTGNNTSVTTVQLSNAQSIILDQNVPNPFAEQTVINYVLPDDVQKAQMLFYNNEGKLINSVELTERGKGQLNVFAPDLSNGIYTYILVVDGKIVESKKMIKH